MQTRCSLGAGRFGSAEAGKGSRGSRAPQRSRGGAGGPSAWGEPPRPAPVSAGRGSLLSRRRVPGEGAGRGADARRRETAGRGGTRRFVPGPRPLPSRERPPPGAPALRGVRDPRGGAGSQATPRVGGASGGHALGWAGRRAGHAPGVYKGCGAPRAAPACPRAVPPVPRAPPACVVCARLEFLRTEMADGFTKQSQNFKTAFQTITDLTQCAPVHPHCPRPLFSPADRCWYLINISVFFLLWILVFFALLGGGYKRQGLHLISL
eukprot:XP_022283385.1 uncharacterized protein LOC111098871 [Canis lupus familiaris]